MIIKNTDLLKVQKNHNTILEIIFTITYLFRLLSRNVIANMWLRPNELYRK
jgi:hypothetical protein